MADLLTTDDGQENLKSMGDLRRSALASWVMTKVTEYETSRDALPGALRWKHYYHIWRGIYVDELNNSGRNKERSKLIHPQTMEAVDSTRAEMESAVLDGKLFKIDDDYDREGSQDPQVLTGLEARLTEDFDKAKLRHSLSQVILIGTVFGTGIAKINIRNHQELSITDSGLGTPAPLVKTRRVIEASPLLPNQFVIDPAATNIKDALGCASVTYVPQHGIRELQKNGTYLKAALSIDPAEDSVLQNSDSIQDPTADTTKLVEWSGKVPRALLPGSEDEEGQTFDPEIEGIPQLEVDEGDLVEALVTIASDTTVLKERRNPSLTQDRMFVAYRHDIIPNSFWGRGVPEKGFNPQMSLDAHMRATVEALSLSVHPMFALKQGALPRGVDFKVSPGRNYVFNTEDTRSAVQRIDLGGMDPTQFANTAQLEKMVQMATGTFDTQQISQAQGQGGSGFNMVAMNFIKRTKIAIGNFGDELVNEFVNTAARLYMQIETRRYPPTDVKFKVSSGIGALAKEMEQAQMINLLKTVPADNAAWWILVRGIVERSTIEEAPIMVQLVDQQIEQMLNPPKDELREAQMLEIQNRIRMQQAQALTHFIRVQAEVARAANDAAKADTDEALAQSEIVLNLAKAEAEEIGTQMNQLKGEMEALVNSNQNQGVNADASIATAQEAASNQILGLFSK